MALRVEIVVAKYEESLKWLYLLPYPHTIYDKGPMSIAGAVSRPNVGREAETWLHHIIDRYDSLADVTVFLQGHPLDHGGAHADPVSFSAHVVDCVRTAEKRGDVVPVNTITTEDGWAFGLVVPLYYEHIFGVPQSPHKRYLFSPGAQYCVPRHNIHTRPKSFYKGLHRMLVAETRESGGKEARQSFFEGRMCAWTIERLWMDIFNADTSVYSSIPSKLAIIPLLTLSSSMFAALLVVSYLCLFACLHYYMH